MPCIHAIPLTQPCPACETSVDKACLNMAVDILQGRYDLDGYRPMERAAQQRRAKERKVSA